MAYFTTYLLGTPFALMATGLNQLIVCQGFARAGMKSILLGAVLNIVLDPVFIFALDMGVRRRPLPPCSARWQAARTRCGFCCFQARRLHHLWRLQPARDGPRAGAGLFAVSDYCHG